jgi:hypothetical protein
VIRRTTTGSRTVAVVLLALVATTAACSTDPADGRAGTDRPTPTTDTTAPAGDGAADEPYSAVPQRSATLDQLPPVQRPAPVSLQLDAAGIGAPVVPVSADPGSGELAVPPSPEKIAWYEHGPSPGEAGSAVLAAHVDWKGERGAFFTLADVEVGALAVVTMEDGREVDFRVTAREQVAKSDLPVDRIFDRVGPSQLALVTCGGEFDRRSHSYADNIVVFAQPVEP